ncbi:MAG: hypothetical protein EWV50_08455 [Microcystis aeruginosa Ma_MB_F_20061100_S20]|uniref:Uncharacterized protein n=1 Tax=Microcystis aeruginosa Ma_MB_F_20061100_S20D TaxID=2486253 RepID=A0A552ECQ5_MICAE|nr:MAG: hypothetical protein EWV78_18465 [Microcystis aeruginosa Ma_MB_F_20061100_S20D]TRU40202.1 MAG: hypothetical protein EWV50_08455 [Microcystis aeruginosa Ma_MB_F_20061100_S20]
MTEKDFYDYFAEETISIGFVSTHKPEEPKILKKMRIWPDIRKVYIYHKVMRLLHVLELPNLRR